MVAVVAAVDGDVATGGRVEPENQAHRGRLAGAVRPEEARHDARSHAEAEPVDRALRAVVLREVARLDHESNVARFGEAQVRMGPVRKLGACSFSRTRPRW